MHDLYTPKDWYWVVAGDTARAWSSAARAWVAEWDATRCTSVPAEADITDALSHAGCPGLAPPSVQALDAEYTRRLVALLGARDLAHTAYIRADDLAERINLRGVATPTTEQTARIAELQTRDAAIVALIEAYNAIPDAPVPADYAAASRWP